MRYFLMPAAAIVLAAFFFAFQSKEAPAAPIVGDGSFNLPMGQTEDLWTGPPSSRVAARVSSTAGQVQVESVIGGATTILGLVGADQACIFEGNFELLRIRAMAQGASTGSYENRAPIELGQASVTVGSGESIATGTPYCFYKSDATNLRWLNFSASGGNIEVRTSSAGTAVADANSGSDSFTYKDTTEFWVAGSGTILFEVNTVDPPRNPTTTGSTLSTGEDSKIEINQDGTVCITGKIENTGDGDVEVKIKFANKADTDITLPPGSSVPFTCKVTRWSLKFASASGKVTWETTPVS